VETISIPPKSSETEPAEGGFSKLIDRLLYSDIGLRRRLITGTTFFTTLIVYGFAFRIESLFPIKSATLPVNFIELAKSTQLTILILLLLYAMGALIEVVSDGFVVRGAARMSLFIGNHHFRWLPLWPLLFIYGLIQSTRKQVKYTIDLDNVQGHPEHSGGVDIREPLSTEAANLLARLPSHVRAGLDEPFGGKFDAAWQTVLLLTPAAQKQWVADLRSSNHETSSFLSAAFAATTFYFCLYLNLSRQHIWNGFWAAYSTRTWGDCIGVIAPGTGLYLMLIFIAYLFLGFLSLVRRSIASTLEFIATNQLVRNGVLHAGPQPAATGPDK
jgi:hypothetical protein